MRVLVTGGAGFIGSHIVDSFVQEGHEVAVVDDLSTGRADNLNPGARVYSASITDLSALEEVFAREAPQLVSHHAAHTSVRHSMADPSFDAEVNVVGSINVLQLCVKHGARKLLFASSCAVYSEPSYLPMDESHPVRPQSAYGVAKYAVESYVRFYADVHGLTHTIFRYGNVYGPRQNPHAEAGVVAIFAGQLLRGVQPTIFGDGSKTRDYVFVEDVVNANLLAMGERGDNEVYNLGRGEEVSDLEIFEAVRQATGADVEPIYEEKRPGEADRVRLDCSKAREGLAWAPKVQIKEGVLRAAAHHRQRHQKT